MNQQDDSSTSGPFAKLLEAGMGWLEALLLLPKEDPQNAERLRDVVVKLTNPDHLEKAFKAYRDEEKHECTLLQNRINALLASQSLFSTGYAIVFVNDFWLSRTIALLLAIAALVLDVIYLRAIICGCRIQDRWHAQGKALLDFADEPDHADNCAHIRLSMLLNRRGLPQDRHHVIGMTQLAKRTGIAFLFLWSALFVVAIMGVAKSLSSKPAPLTTVTVEAPATQPTTITFSHSQP